ncbi:MAG: PLP-dependent aminotransferase family protein [Actinobacteria bacterium]|nr:PLP-dependent aminotransferase family protein [Actinomycetota bacterium]
MKAISFARGIPAPESLPRADLADCARAAIERDGSTVLNYGPAGGYGPLREWLAARHRVGPERVVLTNGSLQGFLFLARCLARRGPVLVEAPTYDRPLRLLEAMGAEVVTLPLDDEGLDVNSLELLLRQGLRPSFLYTIPTFQNPSGKTLSKARRRRLVRLARRYDLLLVEDDPYGLVRFEGTGLPTLFELDGGANVVYGSSFSKTVAPGLRVGYLVLPNGLASEVEAEASSTYITPALIPQATTYEYLHRGLFEGNLARIRDALQARRDAMVATLARELPDARWTAPKGGYFLWLELPEGFRTADVVSRAQAAGVRFVPGSDFFLGRGGECALRLAYSLAPPAEIDEGVTRLAAAVGCSLRSAA